MPTRAVSRGPKGHGGRAVGDVREADVGRQRRGLRALQQGGQTRHKRDACHRTGGELRHVLPADSRSLAHPRLPTPDLGGPPPGRYSRPPVLATATDTQYELVLMLDPDVPDERRDQIADETRKRIESAGTLKHDSSWGMRKLAYEIRQRTEADYRLFRFEGEGGVLDDLNHNLRIADGVLRFRIFKVDPSSPQLIPPPAMGTSAPQRTPRRQEAPAPDAGATEEAEAAPEEGPSAPAAAAPEPAEAPAEEPPAEAPAESGAEEPSE
jgi:small subunit ribosomal protein S6